MYETFFGFAKRPFASAPQVDQYFPGATIEDARQTLARCLERGEGAGVVVGPSGTGKTLLCHVLAVQCKDLLRVAVLSTGRLGTRRALFQAILYELGRGYRGMDENESRLALVGYLTDRQHCPRGTALLVDEAHTLSVRLLDELRMLGNLSRDGVPLVRLVLAGAATLEERFANPRLDSLNQRIVARCYLESFNRAETQDYIQSGINAVGADGERIFPEPACRSVHQATDGVPRLINQLCDHALVLACLANQRELSPRSVEEAWADLQRLPTPWNEDEQECNKEAASLIEFGGLDESADPPAAAAEPPAMSEPPATSEPASLPELTDPGDQPEAEMAVESECLPVDEFEPFEESAPPELPEDAAPGGSPESPFLISFDNDFDELSHAFREKFIVEEVVADRYSSPAGQPRVQRTTDAVEGLAPDTAGPDILVVEDDYDEPPAPPPVVPIPRQEYRRLFARLRRG